MSQEGSHPLPTQSAACRPARHPALLSRRDSGLFDAFFFSPFPLHKPSARGVVTPSPASCRGAKGVHRIASKQIQRKLGRQHIANKRQRARNAYSWMTPPNKAPTPNADERHDLLSDGRYMYTCIYTHTYTHTTAHSTWPSCSAALQLSPSERISLLDHFRLFSVLGRLHALWPSLSLRLLFDVGRPPLSKLLVPGGSYALPFSIIFAVSLFHSICPYI